MRLGHGRNGPIVLLHTLAIACCLVTTPVNAQDLEPRRWSHLPVGMNTLAVGYAGMDQEIYFDPALGITDGTANLNAWQQGRTQTDAGSDPDSWLLSWAIAWGHR